MLGTVLISAVVHSREYLMTRSIGVAGGLVSFFALVLRHPARREGAISSGTPPRGLSLRGFRPARTRQWSYPAWFVTTPRGWRWLDRVLVLVAIAGGATLAATIVVIEAAGLH
jgi:hypothetical protein